MCGNFNYQNRVCVKASIRQTQIPTIPVILLELDSVCLCYINYFFHKHSNVKLFINWTENENNADKPNACSFFSKIEL